MSFVTLDLILIWTNFNCTSLQTMGSSTRSITNRLSYIWYSNWKTQHIYEGNLLNGEAFPIPRNYMYFSKTSYSHSLQLIQLFLTLPHVWTSSGLCLCTPKEVHSFETDRSQMNTIKSDKNRGWLSWCISFSSKRNSWTLQSVC